ncbi:MAG: ester cyclase [Anaerolineae bacterium]|nr:ester cyclase [Anaerolineae bacterium]
MFSRIRSTFAFVFIVLAIAASLPIVGIAQAQTDQTAANKAAAALLLEVMSDAARLDEFDSYVSEDFAVHIAGSTLDWAAMKGGAAGVLAAMPDLRYTPLILVAEGNYVGMRYEFAGTFTNPMANFDGTMSDPTGEPVVLYSNAILTFTDDGKLAGYQEIFDTLSFAAQLGQFPAPEGMIPPVIEIDPAVWTLQATTAEFTAALKDRLLTANLAAYDQGDLDALDAAYAPDFTSYVGSASDLAGTKAGIAALRAAMPDMVSTNDTLIAEGNWVVYRWTASGTFTGGFDMAGMVVPPTNQPLFIEGIAVAFANEDGLIAGEWSEIDNMTILAQMGMLGQ